MQTHEHVLHWLKVTGAQHHSAHLQRVDMVASREGEAEAVEHVTLVVVLNGIREVNIDDRLHNCTGKECLLSS